MTDGTKKTAGPGKRLLLWLAAFAVWNLLLDLIFTWTLGYDSGYHNWQEWVLTIFEIITGWIVANRVEWHFYGKRPEQK